MCFQIVGLCFDIIGVILLAFGGVFPVARDHFDSYDPVVKKKEYFRVTLARIGLILAVIGFILQMIGVYFSSL